MRVLVATDGSPRSLEMARRVAGMFDRGSEFVLLSAIPPREDPEEDAGGIEGPLMTPEEASEEHRATVVAAHAWLAETARAFGPVPLEQRVEVVSDSDIGATICRVADETNADIIAVGSHGRGAVRDAFLGSVSHHVIQHADRPVLVVPSHGHAER